MTKAKLHETMKLFIEKKAAMEQLEAIVNSLKSTIIQEVKSYKMESVEVDGIVAKLTTYDRESVSIATLKEELTDAAFAKSVAPHVTTSKCEKLSVKETPERVALIKALGGKAA